MPSPQSSDARRGALVASLSAAGIAALVEVVFSTTGGARHSFGYVATTVGMSLGVAFFLGVAGAIARVPAAYTAAVWAALAGWMVAGAWTGVATAVAFGAVLSRKSVRAAPAAIVGVAVGGAWALATLVAPRVLNRLDAAVADEAWMRALAAASIGAIGAAVACWIGGRVARAASPALGASTLALLFLGASAKPLLSEHRAGIRRLERDLARPTVAADATRPNVFVLVLDTLRADRMSIYGYERETTPELARLVAAHPGARVYRQAYANATWTVPSHATLMCGLLTSDHGADFARAAESGFRVDAPQMLAEGLHARGWETVSVFANFWLWRVRGMERGFEHYERARHGSVLPLVSEEWRALFAPSAYAHEVIAGPLATDVDAALLDAIETPRTRPLYVFANYADAHGPYVPTPQFRGRFAPWSAFEQPLQLSIDLGPEDMARIGARYDEEVLALDHELGRFLDELERRDLLGNGWVFITSDHGEAFGEHGVTEHGTAVYDEVVRVPLVVFPPRGSTMPPDSGPVSLADVAATVGAIAGVDVPGPGVDLRRPLPPNATAIVEFQGDPAKADRHGELALQPAQAIVRGRHKLIRYAQRVELYDVVADPGEKDDLARKLPDVVKELTALLPAWDPKVLESADWSKILPRDDLEKLKGVGYLGGDDH